MIDVRMDFESYYNADSDGKIQLIEEMLIKAIKKVKTKGKFDLEKFKKENDEISKQYITTSVKKGKSGYLKMTSIAGESNE